MPNLSPIEWAAVGLVVILGLALLLTFKDG